MDGQQGYWSEMMGALSGAGQSMKAHPERTAIALDMLGRGFAPDNPFAGIGTALGKSSLAAKAETAGQKESAGMFQQLLSALTPGDKPGPTSFTATLGKDGKGIDYGVKGLEGLEGMGEPTKMSGVETPKILTEEDFASRFGEGGF